MVHVRKMACLGYPPALRCPVEVGGQYTIYISWSSRKHLTLTCTNTNVLSPVNTRHFWFIVPCFTKLFFSMLCLNYFDLFFCVYVTKLFYLFIVDTNYCFYSLFSVSFFLFIIFIKAFCLVFVCVTNSQCYYYLSTPLRGLGTFGHQQSLSKYMFFSLMYEGQGSSTRTWFCFLG